MDPFFQIIVLGCTGGPWENNLSGYLFSPVAQQEWIALDAGSLLCGMEQALKKNNLSQVRFLEPKLSPTVEMMTKHLRAYLVSHTHLDHIMGLVINSQIDSKKEILGIDPTINNLRDHIFNGKVWPNYGNEGVEPLGRYTYRRLVLEKRQPIDGTSIHVEPFLLSHPDGYPSTAFLLEYQKNYFLYFGDTSSDFLEPEKRLTRIWERIAPLLRENSLKGMMLECSYPKINTKGVAFGHLNTTLLLQELHQLQKIAQTPLQGFKVIVTHRKEGNEKDIDLKEQIRYELRYANNLGIDFLFPTQGDRFLF